MTAALLCAALVTTPTLAQTTVNGRDRGIDNKSQMAAANVAGSSNFAAASFDASVSGSTLITFESGNSNVVTGSGGNGSNSSVTNSGVQISITNTRTNPIATTAGSRTTGFNTTAVVGNGNRLYADSSNDNNRLTVTFNFANVGPIDAFGAFFGGVGSADGTLRLNFTSGGSQTFDLTNLIGGTQNGQNEGGVGFFGVFGIAPPVSSIVLSLNPSDDIFSVDDIRFRVATVPTNLVPEPSAVAVAAIFGAGLAGLVIRRRRTS